MVSSIPNPLSSLVLFQSCGSGLLSVGTPYLDIAVPLTEKVAELVRPYFADQMEWAQEGNHTKFEALLTNVVAINESEPSHNLGGSAGNVARAAQRAMQGPGLTSTFFGKFGEDTHSRLYLESMKKLGVSVLAEPSTDPIGRIMVFESASNRRFICNPATNLGLSEESLSEEAISRHDLLHFEGYALRELPIPFLQKTMERAQSLSKKVSFDLGADRIIQESFQKFQELLPFIDILFANEAEVNAVFECLHASNTESATKEKTVAEFLLNGSNSRIAVFLKGACGATVFARTAEGEVHSFDSQAFPLPDGASIHPNGAGDHFIAAFLVTLLEGGNLQTAAQNGNRLGSAAVQVPGTEIPVELWPNLSHPL